MDTYIATDDGQFVSEKMERMARIIMDYDQNLQLRWIPADKRTREDKSPYQIVDTTGGTEYIVFHFTELDSPEEVLARLFMGDNKQGNVLTRLEAQETANKLMQLKRKDDELEEMMDQAKFMFGTPLHYIKMGRDDEGKLIRMDDHRRRI